MHRCRVNLSYTPRWFYSLLVLPGDQHPGLFPPPSHEGHLSGSAQVRAFVHPPARPPSSTVFCSAPPTVLHLFISHLPSAVTTCSEANSFPSRRVTSRTGKTLCHPRDGPDSIRGKSPGWIGSRKINDKWQRWQLKILQNWPLCDHVPHWMQAGAGDKGREKTSIDPCLSTWLGSVLSYISSDLILFLNHGTK